MIKMIKNLFYKQIIEQLDKLHENDPKTFLKTLKHLKKSLDYTYPITMFTWYDYLSKLYSEYNSDFNLADLEMNTEYPLDFPFTCKEECSGITKPKNNKQPGIYLILNDLFKYGKDILLLPFVKLFNRIFKIWNFSRWNVYYDISFFHLKIFSFFSREKS